MSAVKRAPGEFVRWLKSWPDDQDPQFRIGKIGEDLVAEWIGFATLRADRSGSRADYQILDENTYPEIADKFYRGQVRGLIRHLQGRLTLHGAAAAVGGAAVVMIGGSGTGKSGTVAAFCTLEEGEFLADDMTALAIEDDCINVTALETHHWLLADSIAALDLPVEGRPYKQPIAPARAALGPARLAAIIKLEFDNELSTPELKRCTGGSVFEMLSTSAIRFALDDPAATLRDFEQIAIVAARIPVYTLRRPRDIKNVAREITMIANLLAKLQKTNA